MNRECAYMMSIGMPYEMFWYGDALAIQFYIEADEKRREREDRNMWIQGAYIYQALCAVAPILQPFTKAKKPEPYMDQPMSAKAKEEQRRNHEQEVQNERLRGQLYFEQWARDVANHFEK